MQMKSFSVLIDYYMIYCLKRNVEISEIFVWMTQIYRLSSYIRENYLLLGQTPSLAHLWQIGNSKRIIKFRSSEFDFSASRFSFLFFVATYLLHLLIKVESSYSSLHCYTLWIFYGFMLCIFKCITRYMRV